MDAAQVPAAVPVTRLDDRPGISDLDAPHAVTLTIAQPIAIKDALLLLVRGTAFSIVIADAVDATFSGELKDVTLRQALDAVLRPQGLDYTLDGQLISVHRRRVTMRLFDVSYLNVTRESQRGDAALVSRAGSSYFDEIERGVAALLSRDGRAHVDRRHSVVQVTDFAEHLDRVATYLETVHVRALRQVRLTARIVEVTLNDPASQAIDWKAIAQRSGEAWDGAGATAGVRVQDFDAVLTALAAQGSVRTLASPQLLAMNNEPALMRVNPGFLMTITPYIDAGGMVHLSLSPTYSERVGDAISTAEVDTVLRMREGDSVLVAGLLQRRDATRSEVVILLNATVVTAGPAARTGAR